MSVGKRRLVIRIVSICTASYLLAALVLIGLILFGPLWRPVHLYLLWSYAEGSNASGIALGWLGGERRVRTLYCDPKARIHRKMAIIRWYAGHEAHHGPGSERLTADVADFMLQIVRNDREEFDPRSMAAAALRMMGPGPWMRPLVYLCVSDESVQLVSMGLKAARAHSYYTWESDHLREALPLAIARNHPNFVRGMLDQEARQLRSITLEIIAESVMLGIMSEMPSFSPSKSPEEVLSAADALAREGEFFAALLLFWGGDWWGGDWPAGDVALANRFRDREDQYLRALADTDAEAFWERWSAWFQEHWRSDSELAMRYAQEAVAAESKIRLFRAAVLRTAASLADPESE